MARPFRGSAEVSIIIAMAGRDVQFDVARLYVSLAKPHPKFAYIGRVCQPFSGNCKT
jgi:hypothetical protein